MASRARKRGAAPRKSSAGEGFSALRWLGIGWVSGLFTALLIALFLRGDPDPVPTAKKAPAREARQERPAPRFDFYTTLPGEAPAATPGTGIADVVEIDSEASGEFADPEIEPAPVPPAPVASQFMLQAGSFRMEADADRRRAELLLLGLTPEVSVVDTDSGRWYRVFLGPFSERAELDRVRAMTAQQNIDTLPLQAEQR